MCIKSNKSSGELCDWLSYLEQINPNHIELGLDRVRAVLGRLNLDFSHTLIVQAAGTNGKGSSCALIDAAARAAGLTSCLYTSPHLERFNERVQINGREATDEELAEAFAAVYAQRGGVELTYFEYTTLAAFYLFARARPDLMVLEIGLGGRLDAVNVLDADIALITSIGLDHVRILGDTITAIATEKAGIIKPGAQCVAGLLPPEAAAVLQDKAQSCGAELFLEGRDFAAACSEDGEHFSLSCQGHTVYQDLPLPLIPLICAPSALQVVRLLNARLASRGLEIDRRAVESALRSAVLPGRMQQAGSSPLLFLDVAHNVPAARHLAQVLQQHKQRLQAAGRGGRLRAVIGMLRDKDIEGVLQLLSSVFDDFYTASLHTERGEQAGRLNAALAALSPEQTLQSADTVAEALQLCLEQSRDYDEIVVLGSFVTVGEARAFLRQKSTSAQ